MLFEHFNALRAFHASAHDDMLTSLSHIDKRFREMILVNFLKLHCMFDVKCLMDYIIRLLLEKTISDCV